MDEADYAQQNEELFRGLALRDHFRRTVINPREAETQAGAGRSPGLSEGANCLDCEEPISQARLRANPQAVRCIGCQDKFERRANRG